MMMTSEERTVKLAYLADARSAYHKLVTGTQAKIFVDQNGERIEYSIANRDTLKNYVKELEMELGLRAIHGPMTLFS